MDKLSIIGCISEAWDCFRKNPGLAIGGFLVYLAVIFMGSIIPFISLFFTILIAPALLGGFMFLFLNLAGNGEAKLEDLFAGFSRYSSMMGLYWMLVGVTMLGLVPSFIYLIASGILGEMASAALVAPESSPPAAPVGFFIVYFFNLVALGALLLRFMFAWFVLADDPKAGVFDALKMSAFLMKDHMGKMLLLALTLSVIGVVSVFAFIIGYFVAAPILMIAFARAYLNLQQIKFHPQRRSAPTPTPTSPPPEQSHAPLPPQ